MMSAPFVLLSAICLALFMMVVPTQTAFSMQIGAHATNDIALSGSINPKSTNNFAFVQTNTPHDKKQPPFPESLDVKSELHLDLAQDPKLVLKKQPHHSESLEVKSEFILDLDHNQKLRPENQHHYSETLDGKSELHLNLDQGTKHEPFTTHDDEDSVAMLRYLARARRGQDSHDSQSLANVTCEVCEYLVGEVRALVRATKAIEDILAAVANICSNAGVTSRDVCVMVSHEYQDQIIYIANHLVLSPKEMCGIVLGKGCATPYFPGHWWDIKLPATPKPPVKPPVPPKPDAPKLRVLQLTDIHLDPLYEQGTPIFCRDPLCCRANTVTNTSHDHDLSTRRSTYTFERAGMFGSYWDCDLPLKTATNLFQHLSSIQDQFDYVLFTGDIPPHDIWNQSQHDQTESIRLLDYMLTTYLPNKPVFQAVGNHESSPCNSFPPPGIPNHNSTWLYDALAAVWGRWLPSSAVNTVAKCGSYSHSPFPGFRIISVNNNYCNVVNFWLLLNSTDPCHQLQWLIKELQSAEDKGEKVHLLLHLPPGGSECYKAWSWNFYKIVSRYESTIVNQFYGHDHRDWFQMFYDDQDFQRPVSVGFSAPSVTTYSSTNPAYRIYTIDGNYTGSSWAVLDYTTYYFNLTKANKQGKLMWTPGYSAKKDLKMTGLYAADWEDLARRMEQDDKLFQQFYRYFGALHTRGICVGTCKADLLCKIREGRSFDPGLCDRST